MKQTAFQLIFLILCMVFQSISSYGQYGNKWTKIGQLPLGDDGLPIVPSCGFFFAKNYGMVGKGGKGLISSTGGSIQIFYTHNGLTFIPSKMPSYFKNVDGRINKIDMLDRSNGFAVVSYNTNKAGPTPLLQTSDGGASWFDVNIPLPTNNNTDIYIIDGNPTLVNWTRGPSVAAIDSNVMVLSNNFYSYDRGNNWLASAAFITSPPMNECWGVFGSWKWKTFFCAPEDSDNPIFGPILSLDSGRTWLQIGSFPEDKYGRLHVTGDVRGGRDAIYVQSSVMWNNAEGRGLCRTTDGGKTWKNINGPSNYQDTRFCVFGCRGANVVAFDTIGGIWLTENGGDGTMHEDTARLWFNSKQLSMSSSLCDTASQGIRLWNEHCNIVRLDSMWFDSRDSFLFTSGALSIDTIPYKGRILGVDGTDSIGLRWRPRIVTDRDTTYDVPLRIRYWTETTNEVKDTVLLIELNSLRGTIRHTLSSSSVEYPPLSMCTSKDTTITITNNGCDTLRIDDARLQGSLDYTIIQNPTDIRLAPGDSAAVTIRYSPSSIGVVQASLFITIWEQGKVTTREIPLRGIGTEGDGEFAYEPKQFDLKTLSICGRDSASGFISNTGCDTLMLSDATLFASGDYTLSSLPARKITPDDTIRYTVYLNPQQKGIRTGYVVFTTSNRSGARKDSVAITATVTDGTRILASSPNTLDFGTTTLCQERDSVVTLRNTGCDTLKVTGVRLQGVGFSSNVTTPIIIPPGGSVEIPVNTIVDTSQGSISTGTITFTSDADNQIPPIPLSRGYTYPKSYSFHLGMPTASGTADDIVRLAIVGEQGLGKAGSNVSRLDFDLALNEDLLEYITYEGSNQVTKNGNHITIANANELANNNDTLAILRYRVFLTKDSATDISVSNISLNDGDTSRCAPQIAAATQAGFSYRYECGDRHIQSFLRTGRASLEITSIRPNPAKDEITLRIRSSARQNASIEIYNLLGTMVIGKQISLENERTDIAIQLHELPEGQYIIRVAAPTGSASRMFTKQVK